MKRLLILFSLLIFLIPVKGQFLKTGSAYTKNTQAAGNDFLTNLVAYWKFEEASGTLDDAQGSNNSESCTADYGSTGINGDCLSFTAANSDCVILTDAADLRMYDQDLTFVAWIYITDLPGTGVAYSVLGGENSSAGMFLYGTTAQLKLTRVVTAYNAGGPTISINGWHMIGISFDNSETTNNVTMYVDGNTTTVSFNDTFLSDRGTIYIGRNGTDVQQWYFNGLIDEVMIWKGRILTSDEFDDLYNTGTGLFFDDFK